MLFNSYEFLIFFPICLIVYFILPNKPKIKNIWLVVCSYYFYAIYNVWYAVIIFAITFISYFAAKFISENKFNVKKVFLWSFGIILSIFFIFKYLDFSIDTIVNMLNRIFNKEYNKAFNIILPAGISFYTLQAISYVCDVYNKKIKHDKNFLNYILYISFFPQLVAGPIERASDFLPQIDTKKSFDYFRFKKGALRMLAGFFQKIVIADRAAIFVNLVYNDISNYSGVTIIIATFIFGVQIYCDFAGYSNIAIGAAEILGFKLKKNFDSPYMSCSISEFWKRWHITFSSWLRDYIYIPLGGNRCSKIKNYRNLIITFLISGIWHGANFTYAIWGIVNGIYLVIEKSLNKYITKFPEAIRIGITFCLVNLTWLFFRANSIKDVGIIFKNVFTNFNILNINEMFLNGAEYIEIIALIIAILIMNVVQIFAKKNDIFKVIFDKNIVIRWTIYYLMIFSIIIFGVYGIDAANTEFIYSAF